MPVRFVMGRAGTGKTHHCVEAIRSRLRHDPVNGPRLILLVPEQAGLQMERAIIDPAGGCRCAHRADVVSFQRLAVRVLEDLGEPERVALSESARAMVLRHLLSANHNALRYYTRAARDGQGPARMAGLVDRLSRGVSELIEESVDPDAYHRAVDGLRTEASVDPGQFAKLQDIAIIYRAYIEYLGEAWLDPARRLELARGGFDRCDWVQRSEVWVDGFASFSGQERDTLVALARRADHVDITVLGDARNAVCSDSTPSGVRADYLFAKTTRTQRELHQAMVDAGIEVHEPLALAPDPPPRFSRRPELVHLEQGLFGGAAAIPQLDASDGTTVSLRALPTRRLEVDYAVSCICGWVQGSEEQNRYRYRDVAIIVRDLQRYQDLIREALSARHIPHFIDARRPVTNHPLVELLRALVSVAAQRMALEPVRLLLKCGLMPLPSDDLDELENYLLRHGISGLESWRACVWRHRRSSELSERESPDQAVAVAETSRVDATRQNLWQRLAPWVDFASRRPSASGSEWRAALLDVWNAFDVASQLARREAQAVDLGDLDLAEQLRAVWKQVCSLLDDLAFVFRDQPLSIGALEEVLEAGLSQVSLGLVPPMIDQVLVGSIERSRHPNIKAAVIIGFNDGIFPRLASEDALIDDDDRSRLDAGGVRVGFPAKTRVLDESLLAYIALTRPSEMVVVTWASADEEGRALRPSPYVRAIQDAVPAVCAKPLGDPARDRTMWDMLAPPDLTSRIALEFRGRYHASFHDKLAVRRWNQIYQNNRGVLAAVAVDRRALTSLSDPVRHVALPRTLVDGYIGRTLHASVSSLETYAACPFQYFARNMLRLRQREERDLEPVDVGNIHHAVLEDFFRQVVNTDGAVAAMSDDEMTSALETSCGRIGSRLQGDEMLSSARDAYVLSRSARRLMGIVRSQRLAAVQGRMRPRATEQPFGFGSPGALPALAITTPKGRIAELHGYIDRIDLAELGDEMLGVVVDYKTGRRKRLDLSRVYHGLSLQLLGYLLVLRDCGMSLAGRPIKPGGALFVSLARAYTSVPHPSELSDRDVALRGTERPRGLLSERCIDLLDATDHTDWSKHYQVYRKKDGTFGHVDSSDAVGDDSFRATLDHLQRCMGELVDGILDGDMSVRPYRLGNFSPCAWCAMDSVCRFEFGACDVDSKQILKRSEVFSRIGKALADAPERMDDGSTPGDGGNAR